MLGEGERRPADDQPRELAGLELQTGVPDGGERQGPGAPPFGANLVEIAVEEHIVGPLEEGARLVKICQEKLAEAEVKIQQLEKNAAGEMKLKPFESSEE